MSHTTKIQSLVYRDVAALRAAVEELQGKGVRITLLENAVPRMYFQNQHSECAFVVRCEDARYDVGFDLQPDGSYVPVMDTWNNEVQRTIGASCPMPNGAEERAMHAMGQLGQAYAKHAAINQATSDGFIVESCFTDDEGNLQLTLADIN